MTITGFNDIPSINPEVKKYSIKQTGTQVRAKISGKHITMTFLLNVMTRMGRVKERQKKKALHLKS